MFWFLASPHPHIRNSSATRRPAHGSFGQRRALLEKCHTGIVGIQIEPLQPGDTTDWLIAEDFYLKKSHLHIWRPLEIHPFNNFKIFQETKSGSWATIGPPAIQAGSQRSMLSQFEGPPNDQDIDIGLHQPVSKFGTSRSSKKIDPQKVCFMEGYS